jgi:hypothetical protein
MVLDGIRHAFGVGSADEYYAKALERLRPDANGHIRRFDAIRAFEKAAEKADGRPDFRARAEANAALHSFIIDGGHEHLHTLKDRIPQAQWVERPGEPGEKVLADPLIAEIEGRLAGAAAAQSDGEQAVAAHEAAAAAFARCVDHRLVTYPYHHSGDDHVGTGGDRQRFHTGIALMLSAGRQLLSDPDQAAQTLGRAVASFAACGDQERQKQCAELLRGVRTRRTCWMCQREFPGEGTYYRTVSAYVTPYVRAHLEARGQDASSIDIDRGRLVLCRVCQSVVDERAGALLDERLAVMETKLMEQFEQRLEEVRRTLG